MMKEWKWFANIFALACIAGASLMYYGNQYHSGKTSWVLPQEPNITILEQNPSMSVDIINRVPPQENLLDIRSIISLPAWFRHENRALRKDTSLKNLTVSTHGGDKEDITAWENFFYGTSGGLILELGGKDGKAESVSYFFEASAHWRVILIEGNPYLANHLAKNRPNAINFNVAICDKPRQVHFMSRPGLATVNGILEFMSQGCLKQAGLLKNGTGTLDWKKVQADKHVNKIECLPLANILDPLRINHLNFFVLDVEGGELNILKSIDFNKISFDVISVETHRGLDDASTQETYADAVSELLTSRGYVLWARRLGRNSWFVHPNFKPSVKPAIKKGRGGKG